MDIKQLTTPEERLEAFRISCVAFHIRINDVEKAKENAAKDTCEDWGAFDEKGRMTAHIINNHYESNLDGNLIMNGGIGAVSTLPEARENGAIREIFSRLLPEARARGEVISTLYPFNHAFYRKMGYDTVVYKNTYEFAPEVLSPYKFRGEAVQLEEGGDVSEYLALYEKCFANCNCALRRDIKMQEHAACGDMWSARKFAYLLKENGAPAAYLAFTDIAGNPMPILDVTDCAWDGRAGFKALLGFLSRFSADYGTVRISLPEGIDLLSIIRTPKAYDIKRTPKQDYMARVMNTEKLLAAIKKPEGTHFVISVTDDLIPENCGTWEVTSESVTKTVKSPDISVNERSLAQMGLGAVSFAEAELKDDVEVFGNRETLEKVFVRKPIYVADHF